MMCKSRWSATLTEQRARVLWCGRISLLVGVFVSGWPMRVLRAQQTAPSTSTVRSGTSSPAAQLTTSAFEAFSPALDAVDTAWIVDGHRDFTPYTTPNACVAAVEAEQFVADRASIDTGVFDPLHDTLPSAVVSVARRCGTHFSAAAQSVFELRALFELELYRGNDTAALAAAERYLSAQSKDEYPWSLALVVRDLLEARPMRLAAAEAMIARLDSLGPSALEPRYIAHNQLNIISEMSFDVPRMEREGWMLYRLRRQMTPEQIRNGEGIPSGYEKLLVSGARRPLRTTWGPNGWDILYEMLTIEVTRSSTLSEALSRVAQRARTMGMDSANIQTQLRTITSNPLLGFSRVGKPFAPLPATFWFSASGDTVWPRKNRLTLLMWRSGGAIASKNDAMIRHVYQRFGDAIDIVLYTQTEGYFRDSPPLSPAEEAKQLRWYYLEYLKLPVSAVAVLETPFTRMPDGRRVNRRTAYSHPGAENVILVGKDGTILRTVASRKAMDETIAHALGGN